MTGRVTDGIRRACGIVEGMRDNEFAEATVRREAVAEACDMLDEAVEAARHDAWDEGFEAGRERSIEDREAVAWVRERGGLDAVKRRLDWVVGHCSTKQQLDFDFWLSGRVMYELGFEEDMADRDEVERRLLARLMPEGMEWPRYESGEPVGFGDVVSDVEVRSVVFRDGGILLSDCTSVPGWGTWRSYKEPIKRPSKVLDADGVEIRVGNLAADGKPLREGDTVWEVETGDGYVVERIYSGATEPDFPGHTVACRRPDDIVTHMFKPSQLTHQRPVLDADGVPIHVGDTVWSTVGEFDGKRTVKSVHVDDEESPYALFEEGRDPWSCLCCYFTHRAPVLAADGRPLREGETVWNVESGIEYEVVGIHTDEDSPVRVMRTDGSHLAKAAKPSTLTHERPESKCRDCAHWQKDPTANNMGVCWFFYHEHEGQDCYAARRADIGACEEFMPSAKALAERDA